MEKAFLALVMFFLVMCTLVLCRRSTKHIRLFNLHCQQEHHDILILVIRILVEDKDKYVYHGNEGKGGASVLRDRGLEPKYGG